MKNNNQLNQRNQSTHNKALDGALHKNTNSGVEMERLSDTKRNIYLILLIIIFLVGAPLVVFYSAGYRFSDTKLFVKTGGVAVVLREPGSSIYIDGEKVRQTNFFQKVYFFQNIKPENYNVSVEKKDFHTWQTNIQVFPELVSEVFPFMVPTNVPFVDIPAFTISEKDTEVPVREINKAYVEINDIFDEKEKNNDTKDLKVYSDILIKKEAGGFRVMWDSASNPPSYFCGIYECSKEVFVFLETDDIRKFDLYPFRDDVLVVLNDDGLFAVSIDTEQKAQWFPLYVGENIQYLITEQDTIYVKDGEKIGYLQI